MSKYLLFFLMILISATAFSQSADSINKRLADLNTYWKEVSRTVKDGAIDDYRATFHEQAIYVSTTNGESYPISQAFARWKKGFDDTKNGVQKSSVDFRFTDRFGDATTAFERGIFHYSFEVDGKKEGYYVRFDALLIKENGQWKMMMEHQKESVTKVEWDQLK